MSIQHHMALIFLWTCQFQKLIRKSSLSVEVLQRTCKFCACVIYLFIYFYWYLKVEIFNLLACTCSEQDCVGFVHSQRRGAWTDQRPKCLCHWFIDRWVEWIQPAELTTPSFGYTNLGSHFQKISLIFPLYNFKRGKGHNVLDVIMWDHNIISIFCAIFLPYSLLVWEYLNIYHSQLGQWERDYELCGNERYL